MFAFPIFIAIFLMDFETSIKISLFITAMFVLVVELINSAIENVVDMVTSEYHELAKRAKDIASTAVMFSILLHIGCWVVALC
jgi:diacylglycerol kinase (ATP)